MGKHEEKAWNLVASPNNHSALILAYCLTFSTCTSYCKDYCAGSNNTDHLPHKTSKMAEGGWREKKQLSRNTRRRGREWGQLGRVGSITSQNISDIFWFILCGGVLICSSYVLCFRLCCRFMLYCALCKTWHKTNVFDATLGSIYQQVLMMVRLSGFMVLALTCVFAPSMASACWESPACSDLSSKEKMLVRGHGCCPHFFADLGGGGGLIKTQVHTSADDPRK